MKDLRNIIADNNQAVEKATSKATTTSQVKNTPEREVPSEVLDLFLHVPTDEQDNATTLVGRLVQVAQPLDEYAGMIGRVLKPSNLEDEVVVDFTNSPFINPAVKGEYLDEISEQVMDLFPFDKLEE